MGVGDPTQTVVERNAANIAKPRANAPLVVLLMARRSAQTIRSPTVFVLHH